MRNRTFGFLGNGNLNQCGRIFHCMKVNKSFKIHTAFILVGGNHACVSWVELGGALQGSGFLLSPCEFWDSTAARSAGLAEKVIMHWSNLSFPIKEALWLSKRILSLPVLKQGTVDTSWGTCLKSISTSTNPHTLTQNLWSNYDPC